MRVVKRGFFGDQNTGPKMRDLKLLFQPAWSGSYSSMKFTILEAVAEVKSGMEEMSFINIGTDSWSGEGKL
jgi:hypothetical protein